SIWAVFRVFSFRASSIMGLLLGLRPLRLPLREGPRDDLADLGHREGLGQPRPGCLREQGGQGGAQRIGGDESDPAHQLWAPLLGRTIRSRPAPRSGKAPRDGPPLPSTTRHDRRRARGGIPSAYGFPGIWVDSSGARL